MKHTFAILLATSVFFGCSPNKVFLHPVKTKEYQKTVIRDSLVVIYKDNTNQPVFTKDGNNTTPQSYTIESVIFRSSSGNNLNGWLLKPMLQAATITIVYFHGNSGNLLTNYNLLTPLLDRGFQIFMFDYSGFGFSSGEATRENLLMDGLSAIDYIKARPDVSHTKLVIYGQSFGGHLSAVVATVKQEQIAALVVEAAFSSHHDAMTGILGYLGKLVTPELYSAKDSISRFHKPVLIVHSNQDEIVPIYMGKTIFNNANNPKEFFEITGPHVQGVLLHPDEISKKIKSMLQINQ